MYRKLFKTTIIEKKESLSLKKPFFLINTEIKNEPQITESVPSLPNGKAIFVNIKKNIQDIIIKEPESEIIENDLSSSINLLFFEMFRICTHSFWDLHLFYFSYHILIILYFILYLSSFNYPKIISCNETFHISSI